MYARLVRYSLGPGKGAAAGALADEIAPLIAEQPGCAHVTVFGDEDDGEGGIFVLWDSEANANAAMMIVRPKLEAHLTGAPGPPNARLFPVLSR